MTGRIGPMAELEPEHSKESHVWIIDFYCRLSEEKRLLFDEEIDGSAMPLLIFMCYAVMHHYECPLSSFACFCFCISYGLRTAGPVGCFTVRKEKEKGKNHHEKS
jgi:hypothetical protein